MAKPSFQAVKHAAMANLESLLARILPHGKREGDWWRCRVPWRAGDGRNLAVSLTTGLWRDWARPGDEGDVIDLMCRIDGCGKGDAKDRLAGLLGVGDVPGDWKPPAPPVIRCGDCRHNYLRRVPAPPEWCCNVSGLDAGDDVPVTVPSAEARRAGRPCGPTGRLFDAR